MKKLNILIFGENGQLGSELTRILAESDDVFSIDYPDVDFLDVDSVTKIIKERKPDLIVNAAAYTNVDGAESEKERAFIINGEIVGKIAEIASEIGAGLIHYSTDYVFDGQKHVLYVEDDETNPISVYGESKLAGEKAAIQYTSSVVVFRTSWVYSTDRPSFATKVLSWARKHRELKIVDDQISSPMWARYLAHLTAEVIRKGDNDISNFLDRNKGVYHLTGKGAVSRFDWASEILNLDPKKHEQVVESLLPAKTSDFPTPASRPLFSALNCSKFEKTFDIKLKDWEESLKDAFLEI